jgi:hypothetical protein
MGRTDDFLEGQGMSKAEQHAATMRAAAVPVSDFEGETPGPGTYTSRGANLLRSVTQHRAREVKVKKAYDK